jgi:putative membrane protein
MITSYLNKYSRYVIIAMALIYLVGVSGLSIEWSREVFKMMVPFTLLISLVILGMFHEKYSLNFFLLLIIVYLAGLFIEIVGVSTGLVFGGYVYGPTLGPKVWGTPLIIGINWVLLVYCVWVLISRLKWKKWGLALLGAAIMVIYDLFLEPVAIWLDMWDWENASVPLQNYLAWFVISFIFLLLTAYLNPKINNKIAPALFIIQLVFFMVLNLNLISIG